ncbi:MAG: hypothetical protein JW809_10345 [Pirellulales bacterium]|nr:hypothetical protein [Pirellulales bacterium]
MATATPIKAQTAKRAENPPKRPGKEARQKLVDELHAAEAALEAAESLPNRIELPRGPKLADLVKGEAHLYDLFELFDKLNIERGKTDVTPPRAKAEVAARDRIDRARRELLDTAPAELAAEIHHLKRQIAKTHEQLAYWQSQVGAADTADEWRARLARWEAGEVSDDDFVRFLRLPHPAIREANPHLAAGSWPAGDPAGVEQRRQRALALRSKLQRQLIDLAKNELSRAQAGGSVAARAAQEIDRLQSRIDGFTDRIRQLEAQQLQP